MRRIILAGILIVGILSAVEITIVGGGNYQSINPDWFLESGRWGWHGGVLAEQTIFPSLLNLMDIAVEGGFILQQANYSYISAIPEDPPGVAHQLNLIAPLLVKLRLAPAKAFHFQWGVGPSLIRNLYDWWEDEAGDEGVVDKEAYETDLGLHLKGEVNIKLSDRMWLNPAITRQFNLTAKDTWLDRGQNWFFSLGLALKL